MFLVCIINVPFVNTLEQSFYLWKECINKVYYYYYYYYLVVDFQYCFGHTLGKIIIN